MKLSEAEPAIRAAVELMLQRPKAAMPFVVIKDTVTGRFVQFCGSNEERLRFDCPALEIKGVPCLLEVAALAAIESLRLQDLPDEAELKIEESGCSEVFS